MGYRALGNTGLPARVAAARRVGVEDAKASDFAVVALGETSVCLRAGGGFAACNLRLGQNEPQRQASV